MIVASNTTGAMLLQPPTLARAWYKQMMLGRRNYEDAYYERGRTLTMRNHAGDREQAIADYREALRLSPNSERAKKELVALEQKP